MTLQSKAQAPDAILSFDFVNAYGAGGGIELPFGGFKKSGHGREKGFEALYEFCASNTAVFKHG